MRRTLFAAASLAAALIMTGCGSIAGGSSALNPPPAPPELELELKSDNPSESSGNASQPPGAISAEEMKPYIECMNGQGLQIPITDDKAAIEAYLKTVDTNQLLKAGTACEEYVPEALKMDSDLLEGANKTVACMEKHGIKGYPDVDLTDPEVRKAVMECVGQ